MIVKIRNPKNKVKKERKKSFLRNQNVTYHVFAETTHVVAVPPSFASVVIPLT